MNIKRVILYSFIVAFNIYVLWPSPSAARVYLSKAASVVRVERFSRPVLKLHIGEYILVLKGPWSHSYGHGSGVIVSKRGDILTAGHVAKGSDFFLIYTKSGSVYEAGVLAVDKKADLALLQPIRGEPRDFVVAKAYSFAYIGEPVAHIGCPLDFDWLLSQGIVSLFDGLLVVSDTVINPGSSGGALFDLRGRLIGIAVGLMSTTGGYEGHSVFVGPGEVTKFLKQGRELCH